MASSSAEINRKIHDSFVRLRTSWSYHHTNVALAELKSNSRGAKRHEEHDGGVGRGLSVVRLDGDVSRGMVYSRGMQVVR